MNPNYTTKLLFSTIKPFLAEKAKNKAEFLPDSTIETLEKNSLLRSNLPKSVGGELDKTFEEF